jgi:hypothetical protein
MGGDEEPGEPSKNSPDIPGPTVLEDLRARAAPPRAAPPETPAPVPLTTKSYDSFLVLSPSQGLAFATSMLVAPCGSSLAPSTSVADDTAGCRRATGTNEARLLSW